MTDQVRAGVERASDTAHQAVDRVAAAASSAARRLGTKSDELLHAKDEWIVLARAYTRDHPLAAVGIALSLGFLLSRLLSR